MRIFMRGAAACLFTVFLATACAADVSNQESLQAGDVSAKKARSEKMMSAVEADHYPSFESYAAKLRAAILSGDRGVLKQLVGSGYVLSEQNMRFAFDDKERGSLKKTLSASDIVFVIESAQVDDSNWIARIYFVSRQKLQHPEEPSLSQVYDLEKGADYAVCEVMFRNGRYAMRDHFCYDETDL